MASCSNNNNKRNNRDWSLKRQQPELGFKWPASSSEENYLVRKFQNVGLKSNRILEIGETSAAAASRVHPLRPDADDCSFFVRNGSCKFGSNCRYNHPVRTHNQVEQGIGSEKGSEGVSEKSQIACKFYLTPGGCKYGESCRFYHSQSESEIVLPELNFLGLPVRLEERVCPFYMRTGLCGYGACCRFHHPDPVTLGESEYYGDSVRYYGGYSVGYSGLQATWSSPQITNNSAAYMDDHFSYMPVTHQNPGWIGYQAYPQEKKPASLVPEVKAIMSDDLSKNTEKPDQLKSPYPKREPCALSDIGLPLRPGKKICWNYENLGLCKFGRVCAFDHPPGVPAAMYIQGSTFRYASGDNTTINSPKEYNGQSEG